MRRAVLLPASLLATLSFSPAIAQDSPKARAVAVAKARATFEAARSPERPVLTGKPTPGNAADAYREQCKPLRRTMNAGQMAKLFEALDTHRTLPARTKAIYEKWGEKQAALLRESVRRDRCQWDVDLSKGLIPPPSWIGKVRTISAVVAIRAQRTESNEEAVELALATICLGQDLARYPVLIGLVFGSTVELDGYKTLARVVKSRSLSLKTRRALADRLAPARSPRLSIALEAEWLAMSAALVNAEAKPGVRQTGRVLVDFPKEHELLKALHESSLALAAVLASKRGFSDELPWRRARDKVLNKTTLVSRAVPNLPEILSLLDETALGRRKVLYRLRAP